MLKRILAALIAIAVYASIFWPAPLLRDAVLAAYGNPPYEGAWIFIPHVFLYSTLTALLAGIAWWGLWRWCEVAPPRLRLSGSAIIWGLAAGVISILASIAVLTAAKMGALHEFRPDGWKIAGNLFSNFYEEWIYRGFLLAALTRVGGVGFAVVVSSLAFGFSHQQYPLPFQVFVAGLGALWAYAGIKARSLLAPWIAHTVVDVVMDSAWS